ncbi:unnamed protein product [Rotaria sp. Silwood2]|nr:unnamed protein product [Rotaria sp. Silwood2]CAF2517323.1 unnamed protein product [Rotaria sp. Silwood2]CAF2753920.1 unnamed protein product [Rotaria sp. Silwood2]CAF2913038.1 unnamed protein product [Rotaria sp. Silwood2]CAF4037109.1 unnamed protein product [Rotaria sp. Silwood2]
MALALSSNNFEVNIHPVALFNIVHAYERRSEKFDTILGTLLGTRTADSIEVVDSFVVPHSTHSDALYNVDYASTMASFYRKVNSSQGTVGWYSTGSDMISGANLIHEFYTHEARNPVYILVDTSLKNDSSFQIKAYIGAAFGVKDKDKLKSHGTIFTPIPVRIVTYDEEKSAIDLFQGGKFSKNFQVKPPDELDQVQVALDKLLFMLKHLTTYIDDIISGKKPSDPKIGRMLMNLINTVPRVDAKDLENMVNTSMNDLLMIQYLSRAVKAQLVLNEKLTST